MMYTTCCVSIEQAQSSKCTPFLGHEGLLIDDLLQLQVAHFAGNYSLMHLAPNTGSFLLATQLSGTLYERARASHEGQTGICMGYDCFRWAPTDSVSVPKEINVS